jgi:hypothetical protein
MALVDRVTSLVAAELPPLQVDFELADTAAWRAARRRTDAEIARR